MELLLGFLKNPKFNLYIFKLLQDHLMPLRRTKEWGALIPYVVTGILNQHPRAAMASAILRKRIIFSISTTPAHPRFKVNQI